MPTISLTEYYDSQNLNIVPNKNISKKIRTINQLNDFSQLKDNWDTYGASVISEGLIQEVIQYVKKLDKKNIEVYFAAPSPQGDILLELRNKNKSIEIEFLSDNKKVFSTYLDDNLIDTGELIKESEKEILEWYIN